MIRFARCFMGLLVLFLIVLVAPATANAQSPVAYPIFKLGVVLQAPAELENFETLIGRKTDIFLWYQSMDQSLDTASLQPLAENGHIIELAWEPLPRYSAVDPAAYSLRTFTRGDHDDVLRRWARELRDFGHPVMFRPMSEMNGDWTTWSGGANGNAPQDFPQAWRHLHDIFDQEGAFNVIWVWSPNRDGDSQAAAFTFDNYYPGDEYVDFIGFSGYNWGTMYNTPAWVSEWQDFEAVFVPSYDVIAARTSKPIILSETASTELGGDKAQWITDAFNMLPVRFPRVGGLTWFNLNKESDWRVESSSASLSAFRAGISHLDSLSSPCGIPGLDLEKKATYWADYMEYDARILTVDFALENAGNNDASEVTIFDSLSSNGVSLETPLPLDAVELKAGIFTSVRLKYHIAEGVSNFDTITYASVRDACGTLYEYPRINNRV